MNSYLKKNIFETYNNSYIYVERKLKNGAIRKGIVGAIDLEITIINQTPNLKLGQQKKQW